MSPSDRAWNWGLLIAVVVWSFLAPPSCHSPYGRGGSGWDARVEDD